LGVPGIIRNFKVSSQSVDAQPFGNGHINDTFRVEVEEVGHPGYLLQRINDKVFNDIPALMENIHLVTEHLRSKSGAGKVLKIIPTKEGEWFSKDETGYWRVFEFIEGARSHDKAEDVIQSYAAGNAFGRFIHDLTDFPAEKLNITLPDFHNMNFRLRQFEKALGESGMDRTIEAQEEIRFVEKYSSDMEQIWLDAQKLPLRVTHNDTKFNNVLFDEEGKVLAVIDLDTVMPGYVFYDVGDGIRSGVITADEDEQDLSKVKIDHQKYESYMNGFLDAAGQKLTHEELLSLPKSGAYMAFIMGVRFLSDFLNGNIYYKTKYPSHNLHRARCQLYVAELLLEKSEEKF
jgi:Ser/Thr protein kinase RdoA (MazF antagonist)